MPAEHGSGTAFGTDAVPAGSDTNTHAGESGDIRNPAAATEEHFGVETSNTSSDDLHPAVTNTNNAEQGTPGHDDRRSLAVDPHTAEPLALGTGTTRSANKAF